MMRFFLAVACACAVLFAAVASQDICQLPADGGNCRAYFVNYYYNTNAQSCETFIYGGCGGNENRFDTREECEAACP